jgi:hypothetical protein
MDTKKWISGEEYGVRKLACALVWRSELRRLKAAASCRTPKPNVGKKV